MPELSPITIPAALSHALARGKRITGRGLRLAAKNGYLPGAVKHGRDWIIPLAGLDHYLEHRPKPGRKVTVR